MDIEIALKNIGDWISKETESRKYPKVELLELSESLQKIKFEIDIQATKNKETHLCNDCEYWCMEACPITKNVKFGNGLGNENVIECENYINKEALKKWRINTIISRED